jgi:hypothetical protein
MDGWMDGWIDGWMGRQRKGGGEMRSDTAKEKTLFKK